MLSLSGTTRGKQRNHSFFCTNLSLQYDDDETLREEITDYLTSLGVYGDPLPHNYAAQYRMVLDIDGKSWSSRLLTIFANGALVLRAATQSSFLDGYILPYVHYLPVRMDFSDLVSHSLCSTLLRRREYSFDDDDNPIIFRE